MNKTIKKYIIDTAERVVCTFAEALLGVIGASATFGEVNWRLAVSTAGLAAFVSLLKCIVARTKGSENNASLVQ